MPKVEWYRDKKGEFRWRRRADNGEPIAESGEGYVNKEHALKMIEMNFPDDEITEAESSETPRV